jgi:ABC-type amino acid transport system permease subunit
MHKNTTTYVVALVLISIVSFTVQSTLLDKAQKRAFDNGNVLFKIKDSTDFNRVFKEKDDAYIVIYFTVGPDRISQCPYCVIFRKLLAYMAEKEVPKNSRRSTKLYFAMMELNVATQDVASRLGTKHVPALFILTPDAPQAIQCDLSKQQLPEFIQEHTGLDDVQLSQEEMVSIIQEMQEVAQETSHDQSSTGKKSSVFTAVWRGGALLLTIIAVYFFGHFVRRLGNRVNLLTFLAFIFLGVSLGGTVYNMINTPPPFHYNPYNRQLIFFYPEIRMQLVLEGYLAAFISLVCAASFIALTEFIPTLPKESQVTNGLLLMALFWGSFFAVIVFFIFKSQAYLYDTPFSIYVNLINNLFS